MGSPVPPIEGGGRFGKWGFTRWQAERPPRVDLPPRGGDVGPADREGQSGTEGCEGFQAVIAINHPSGRPPLPCRPLAENGPDATALTASGKIDSPSADRELDQLDGLEILHAATDALGG